MTKPLHPGEGGARREGYESEELDLYDKTQVQLENVDFLEGRDFRGGCQRVKHRILKERKGVSKGKTRESVLFSLCQGPEQTVMSSAECLGIFAKFLITGPSEPSQVSSVSV